MDPCSRHTQRGEDALVQELSPRFAAHFLDDHSKQVVAGAAVAPPLAWRKLERARRRPSDDLLGTVRSLGKRDNRRARTLIADEARNPGRMGEELTHGHTTPGRWQLAQVVGDLVVEPELAVLDEQHDPG